MTLRSHDILDIKNTILNAGIYTRPLEITIFENNRQLDDPLIFMDKDKFIKALKKLQGGYTFENAINGQIGLIKGEDYYSLVIKEFNIEFSDTFRGVL